MTRWQQIAAAIDNHLDDQSQWAGGGAAVATDFVSTWETSNTSAGSSTSTQVKLPLESSGTYNFNVDWGDGSDDDITVWNQAETTHTYASAGEYEITITGTISGWRFANTGDRLKLLTITSAPNLIIGNNNGYFYGCANLTSISADIDTSATTNFANAWRLCSSLTSFPLINTSAGTNFFYAWFECSSLTSFPLIDTSSGTTFFYAWQSCSSLTSFPLINTSSGTTFTNTWQSCSSLTSFPAGFGSNMGAMTDGSNMLRSTTLATADYNRLLVEIEAVNSNASVPFHGGNSKHSAGPPDGSAARAALIADHSWTITDGGAA